MKKKIWVHVIDIGTEVDFTFGNMGSDDIIFQTKLTAEQLLQVFQQSVTNETHMEEGRERANIKRDPPMKKSAPPPPSPQARPLQPSRKVKPCDTLDELTDKERIERLEILIEDAAYAIAGLRLRLDVMTERLQKKEA